MMMSFGAFFAAAGSMEPPDNDLSIRCRREFTSASNTSSRSSRWVAGCSVAGDKSAGLHATPAHATAATATARPSGKLRLGPRQLDAACHACDQKRAIFRPAAQCLPLARMGKYSNRLFELSL